MSERWNQEAEMATLGSMILSAGAGEQVASMLRPEMFYSPAHQIIFRALLNLKAPDWLTLKHAVGDLDAAGGEDYLLQVAEAVPTPRSAEFYAGIVREEWERREFAKRAKKLYAEALGTGEIADVRAQAASLSDLGNPESSFLTHIGLVDIGEQGDEGIPTCWPTVNAAISTHGAPAGQLTVLRAYHKSGKSAGMIQQYGYSAMSGRNVVYATFADLNAKQIKRRALRNMCGFSRPPAVGSREEYDQCLEDMAVQWDASIYDASEAEDDDIETFAAWLKAFNRKRQVDEVFVDYWQKLSSNKRHQNQIDELRETSRVLSRLAARIGCVMWVGSQVTEGQNGGKAITKGSRVLEEDAGLVLSLKKDGNQANMEITYSRFGGMGLTVDLRWDEVFLKFREVA